ncbi:MAG: hypothetical protein KGY60_06515, partial [Bacteroidales bacterium]|nr:hypothetical protein [Bacteroidales bacterium]
MNLNNFTIKSQEAMQNGVTIAQQNQNQAVEPGHILKGLLGYGDNVIQYLLKKLDVNTRQMEQVLDSIIDFLSP